MAWRGARPARPLVIVSAIGLFLFGVMVLFASIQRRIAVSRPPAAARALWESGYGNLVTTDVPKRPVQWVVVATTALNAGDAVLSEFVEERTAGRVMADHPEIKPPGELDDERPLGDGFFADVTEVEGKFAALDIPEGTPIARHMLLDRNPLANPLDAVRQDRITVAMPPEPSLYNLLRPGDRVDVFVMVDDALRYSMPSVRVVALNNIIVKGSGIISAAEETRLTAAEQAAQRKKAEIEAEARKRGETTGNEAEQEQAEEPPADETAEGEAAGDEMETKDATGGMDEKDLPEGTYQIGRKFDGRTITLQVSRDEAMLLSLAHSTPTVSLDMALHRRR